MKLTLRGLAGSIIGVLSLLGLAAAISLSLSTSYIHKSSTELLDVGESVNVARTLEVNLLTHSRESLLRRWNDGDTHLQRRNEALNSFKTWLAASRRYSDTVEESKLIDKIGLKTDAYLAKRDRLEAAGSDPVSVGKETAGDLDAVLDLIRQLTDINITQARELHSHSERTTGLLDILRDIVIALMFVLIPGLFFTLKRWLYDPLNLLQGTINRFAREQRAEPVQVGVLELRHISEAFCDMATQLNRQKESQMRYLAAVAHDLRNPIGAIKMTADILVDERKGQNDEVTNFMAIIQRQASQLNRLVSDLLDTVRIERGDLDLQPAECDLRECLHESTNLYRNFSSSHNLRLSLPNEAVVCAVDAVRIGQVVNNFLSNAIKYSPYGGSVDVRLTTKNDEAIISVEDSGIGISPEDQATIFEPFQRSPNTRETIPGVGLGLFTARRIIEAHHGRIELRSERGVGSTFIIYLPLKKLLPEADRSKTVTESAGK